MTDDQGGIAEPPEKTNAEMAPDNLSVLEAVQRKLGELEPEAVEDPEEEAEEEVTEAETEEEEIADGADEDNELVDALGDLDDEESEWVRENPQSRLAKRIGKLVKRAKEAEEKLGQATKRQDPGEENPFEAAKAVEDNPFRELKTTEELSAKYQEITEFQDWAEDLLEEHDDALLDDVVFTEGDKEFTKRDVRKRLRQARKEKETYLPDRHREIKISEQQKQIDTQLAETARKELAWMEDEESPAAKELAAIEADPRFKTLMDKAGDLAGQLRYFMAHAVNSRVGIAKGKPAPVKKPKTPKQTLPTSPMGNAAAPSRGKTGMQKELARLTQQYESTGSVEDAVALQTYRNANNL